MDKAILDDIKQIASGLGAQPNVERLMPEEIKMRAEKFCRRTVFGSCNYVSSVKTLSTALTVYLGSEKVETGVYTQKKRDINKGALQTIKSVHEYLKKAPMVHTSGTLGKDSDFTPQCAFYVSKYRRDGIRVAHMVMENLFPPIEDREADLTVVFIPEWQEKDRQVLVFPEIGVTYVLGTDYFGEAKNAFLRMAMWRAKERDMLGLHAGTKILRAQSIEGNIRRLGMMMFGIAATGKTTHSCHNHDLTAPGEGIEILQDDVVFWKRDGSALGSEKAFYIKTENLSPDTQPLLYDAAVQEDAILENVMVDYLGNVYFDDRTLTANGHGLVQRGALMPYCSDSINMPPIDELDGLVMVFMTRSNSVIPVASKLTCEQAAVAFMLSESIDASGSDQQGQGAPTRGISASPLVIGEASEDCNRFYEMLKANSDQIECYMLNTGGVGEIVEHGLDGTRRVLQRVTRVQIPEMALIIRGIARGTIKWREDANWMVQTPEYVDGLDISKFDLAEHYSQDRIDASIAAIRLDRAEYAAQLPGLDPAIKGATEF
ncbi:phosphoenolpyruvate carboxykinase (ATP) [bacterium]|nr:phosphoenolpyruvate carboxykinase (ATP) [bacterium]